MKALKKHRDREGKWGRFPFYYTLLALTEIDSTAARIEKEYAAPLLERFLKKKGKPTRYHERRRKVAERILGQI